MRKPISLPTIAQEAAGPMRAGGKQKTCLLTVLNHFNRDVKLESERVCVKMGKGLGVCRAHVFDKLAGKFWHSFITIQFANSTASYPLSPILIPTFMGGNRKRIYHMKLSICKPRHV